MKKEKNSYYNGTLTQYATELIELGVGNGKEIKIGEIGETIQNPFHIYEDVSKKELVYVYTHPYIEQKVVKVVVHPNYKKHGRVSNLAKSWGIIHEEDMNGKQYRMIQ